MAKMNMNKITPPSMITNPLMVIIFLIIALIIVLAIFRPASPFLNFGIGLNANIGDLKGSIQFEAFDNQNGPVFAMFYAQWCGHCKTAKPQFQQLMDSYKGPVKIMLVDCEAPENKELVQSQGIKGFPTIRYFPTGISQNFQEYNGARTYDGFTQFLNSVGANTPTVENFVNKPIIESNKNIYYVNFPPNFNKTNPIYKYDVLNISGIIFS
jgi:thiol-disulfide isomerase/thioredoxin